MANSKNWDDNHALALDLDQVCDFYEPPKNKNITEKNFGLHPLHKTPSPHNFEDEEGSVEERVDEEPQRVGPDLDLIRETIRMVSGKVTNSTLEEVYGQKENYSSNTGIKFTQKHPNINNYGIIYFTKTQEQLNPNSPEFVPISKKNIIAAESKKIYLNPCSETFVQRDQKTSCEFNIKTIKKKLRNMAVKSLLEAAENAAAQKKEDGAEPSEIEPVNNITDDFRESCKDSKPSASMSQLNKNSVANEELIFKTPRYAVDVPKFTEVIDNHLSRDRLDRNRINQSVNEKVRNWLQSDLKKNGVDNTNNDVPVKTNGFNMNLVLDSKTFAFEKVAPKPVVEKVVPKEIIPIVKTVTPATKEKQWSVEEIENWYREKQKQKKVISVPADPLKTNALASNTVWDNVKIAIDNKENKCGSKK